VSRASLKRSDWQAQLASEYARVGIDDNVSAIDLDAWLVVGLIAAVGEPPPVQTKPGFIDVVARAHIGSAGVQATECLLHPHVVKRPDLAVDLHARVVSTHLRHRDVGAVMADTHEHPFAV
jgi:hypothetical protein